MPARYTSDVFVSYASEDLGGGVGDICRALFEIGVTSLWMDRLAIKPGDSIPSKIDEGLRSSRYLLPIVSSRYFTKQWTRVELDAVKMLSKKAIPIWIGVDAKQVQAFSPTLAVSKAILYDGDPYEVAEQVGRRLMVNKRTHYFKSAASRNGAVAFWGACYFYILAIVKGEDPTELSLFTGELAIPDSGGATMLGNVQAAIDIGNAEMLQLADAYRMAAAKLGNKIGNEHIAHLICGEIKRRNAWFPHEPREHEALKIVGATSF